MQGGVSGVFLSQDKQISLVISLFLGDTRLNCHTDTGGSQRAATKRQNLDQPMQRATSSKQPFSLCQWGTEPALPIYWMSNGLKEGQKLV